MNTSVLVAEITATALAEATISQARVIGSIIDERPSVSRRAYMRTTQRE
jgi:hypothetical protein